MAKVDNYIFVDESGDPGEPFRLDEKGEKQSTGASPFYILCAMYMNEKTLYALEHRSHCLISGPETGFLRSRFLKISADMWQSNQRRVLWRN